MGDPSMLAAVLVTLLVAVATFPSVLEVLRAMHESEHLIVESLWDTVIFFAAICAWSAHLTV